MPSKMNHNDIAKEHESTVQTISYFILYIHELNPKGWFTEYITWKANTTQRLIILMVQLSVWNDPPFRHAS